MHNRLLRTRLPRRWLHRSLGLVAVLAAAAAAASARSRDSVDTTTTIPGSGVAGMTVVKSTTPPDGTSKVTGFG